MEQPLVRLPFDPPRYNYEDYKKWSDEWELIDGYPYSLMPSAKERHQNFATNFTWIIKSILVGRGCDCQLYYELDWIVSSETVVRPDAMIVCGKIETDWLTFPPALVLEIASDSTYLKDRNVKFRVYELNNVRYYLLADPVKQKIECFELVNGSYQPKNDASFQLAAGCEITVDFSRLW